MVNFKKWAFFLGPKSWFLAKKSDFCHTTPILVNDPFVALGVTVHFPPWDRFFDFPLRSYSSFRKKIRLTRQKVFPLPTVGHRLPVTALPMQATVLLEYPTTQLFLFLYFSMVSEMTMLLQRKTFMIEHKIHL